MHTPKNRVKLQMDGKDNNLNSKSEICCHDTQEYPAAYQALSDESVILII